jgi:hypothetical protein
VIRQLIVDQGWGVDYVDDDTDWASFDGQEPDEPDNCITVYDTEGVDQSRAMATGERQESHGFQVRVRSKDKKVGFAKARQIAVGFDTVYMASTTVDGVVYRVWAIKRNGEPLYIGYEAPQTKRFIHTLNCVVSLRETDEIGGDLVLQETSGYIVLE